MLLLSRPVMSNSLRSHGLQHSRPLSFSPAPRVWPSSCSLHRWCYPAISSSNTLFSFCPHSFPASGTLPMSRLFASDDQNTGASASASAQGWSPLRWLVWSCCPRDVQVFSSTTVGRHQFFGILPSLWSSSHTIHDHGEDYSLDYMDLCRQNNVSVFQHTV